MICKLCGKAFKPKENNFNNQVYCSAECSNNARIERQRDYCRQYYHKHKHDEPKMKKPKPVTLDDVIRECQRQGITYGEWKCNRAFQEVTPIILEVKHDRG